MHRLQFFHSDSFRRGLRTLIDLLLSGGLTSIVLWVLHLFGVNVTLEQVTRLLVVLTPALAVIKNAREGSCAKSFRIDKTRPEPDPVTNTALPIVEGEGTTASDAPGPL